MGRGHRIVAMLTKLGQRGYTIHEETDDYRVSRNDTDTDSDPDSDRRRNERYRLACRAAVAQRILGRISPFELLDSGSRGAAQMK